MLHAGLHQKVSFGDGAGRSVKLGGLRRSIQVERSSNAPALGLILVCAWLTVHAEPERTVMAADNSASGKIVRAGSAAGRGPQFGDLLLAQGVPANSAGVQVLGVTPPATPTVTPPVIRAPVLAQSASSVQLAQAQINHGAAGGAHQPGMAPGRAPGGAPGIGGGNASPAVPGGDQHQAREAWRAQHEQLRQREEALRQQSEQLHQQREALRAERERLREQRPDGPPGAAGPARRAGGAHSPIVGPQSGQPQGGPQGFRPQRPAQGQPGAGIGMNPGAGRPGMPGAAGAAEGAGPGFGPGGGARPHRPGGNPQAPNSFQGPAQRPSLRPQSHQGATPPLASVRAKGELQHQKAAQPQLAKARVAADTAGNSATVKLKSSQRSSSKHWAVAAMSNDAAAAAMAPQARTLNAVDVSVRRLHETWHSPGG